MQYQSLKEKSNQFNIGFINYLNNNLELNYFLDLIINLDPNISKKLNIFIATSITPSDKILDVYKSVNELNIFEDYNNDNFKNIMKNIDLGIVPSMLENVISLSSTEFLSRNIPILSGMTGCDHELSQSKLFRFDSKNEFQNKLLHLMNNRELLTEYKKCYSEVTEEFLKEVNTKYYFAEM
jgi:hypothetical protein